jgi:hypothetical protein
MTFHTFSAVSDCIDGAIRQSLPSNAGPINLAVELVKCGLVPVRAAVALSFSTGAAAIQLAAALELMNLSVHHLHHKLDHQRRAGLGIGIAADVLVGDYMSTGAFRLLVQCGDMAVMGVIANAVQQACEAEMLSYCVTPESQQQDGSSEAIARCARPLGTAAGLAGAILAQYGDESRPMAANFGRHVCEAQALVAMALDPCTGSPCALIEAAKAALLQADQAAEVLFTLTGNDGPRRLCLVCHTEFITGRRP